MPYGDDVDHGRAILGASTVAAVVLAVGLGVAITPGGALSTEALGGGVCGTYPDDATAASAWFLTSFRNDTGRGVRVRDVRAVDVHRVTLSHLAIATSPRADSPGLIVTTEPDLPRQYGPTVPVDSGFVVPAHGELDVVGRIVLRDGADAGRVHGLVATTVGPLGTIRTVTDPESFGVGIGEGHDASDIGCTGA